jgi:hypothetical protein
MASSATAALTVRVERTSHKTCEGGSWYRVCEASIGVGLGVPDALLEARVTHLSMSLEVGGLNGPLWEEESWDQD